MFLSLIPRCSQRWYLYPTPSRSKVTESLLVGDFWIWVVIFCKFLVLKDLHRGCRLDGWWALASAWKLHCCTGLSMFSCWIGMATRRLIWRSPDSSVFRTVKEVKEGRLLFKSLWRLFKDGTVYRKIKWSAACIIKLLCLDLCRMRFCKHLCRQELCTGSVYLKERWDKLFEHLIWWPKTPNLPVRTSHTSTKRPTSSPQSVRMAALS